MREKLTYL